MFATFRRQTACWYYCMCAAQECGRSQQRRQLGLDDPVHDFLKAVHLHGPKPSKAACSSRAPDIIPAHSLPIRWCAFEVRMLIAVRSQHAFAAALPIRKRTLPTATTTNAACWGKAPAIVANVYHLMWLQAQSFAGRLKDDGIRLLCPHLCMRHWQSQHTVRATIRHDQHSRHCQRHACQFASMPAEMMMASNRSLSCRPSRIPRSLVSKFDTTARLTSVLSSPDTEWKRCQRGMTKVGQDHCCHDGAQSSCQSIRQPHRPPEAFASHAGRRPRRSTPPAERSTDTGLQREPFHCIQWTDPRWRAWCGHMHHFVRPPFLDCVVVLARQMEHQRPGKSFIKVHTCTTSMECMVAKQRLQRTKRAGHRRHIC